MNKDSKIYIAGHLGMVGSAITRNLESKGYNNLIYSDIKDFDCRDQKAVSNFFTKQKPEYVFLAAAKVGGIVANNTYRAEFLYDNLQIQNNIIHFSYLNGVKKLLFLGSSCIYPKNAPQPLKEEYLLTGELEYTNEPYAIAKIAGIKLCENYNLQYGTNFISVMPTNLYGPNDNFNLEKSHVLPALIRKMHLGKCLENSDFENIRKDFQKNPIEGIDGNAKEDVIVSILEKYGIKRSSKTSQISVTLWGSGKPRREFLHADDLADACVFLMEKINFKDIVKKQKEISGNQTDVKSQIIRNTHVNIGVGKDISIKELAELIKNILGFGGSIIWDNSKPDGTFQKLLDVSRLYQFGWQSNFKFNNLIKNLSKKYKLE